MKRTEIMIQFKKEVKPLKTNPAVVSGPFYFYPVEFIQNSPEHETKIYETILKKTRRKELAAFVEEWARSAAVGAKFANNLLTAEVCRW